MERNIVKQYTFSPAQPEDLPLIFRLYEQRVNWMDEQGIAQWNTTDYLNTYPLSYYANHQADGRLFVLKTEDSVVGAMVLYEEDKRWQHLNYKTAYYVHILLTDLAVPGMGVRLLSEAEALAQNAGKETLRLDCAIANSFLNSYYEALGFRFVGLCVDGPYRGNCREKILR